MVACVLWEVIEWNVDEMPMIVLFFQFGFYEWNDDKSIFVRIQANAI